MCCAAPEAHNPVLPVHKRRIQTSVCIFAQDDYADAQVSHTHISACWPLCVQKLHRNFAFPCCDLMSNDFLQVLRTNYHGFNFAVHRKKTAVQFFQCIFRQFNFDALKMCLYNSRRKNCFFEKRTDEFLLACSRRCDCVLHLLGTLSRSEVDDGFHKGQWLDTNLTQHTKCPVLHLR